MAIGGHVGLSSIRSPAKPKPSLRAPPRQASPLLVGVSCLGKGYDMADEKRLKKTTKHFKREQIKEINAAFQRARAAKLTKPDASNHIPAGMLPMRKMGLPIPEGVDEAELSRILDDANRLKNNSMSEYQINGEEDYDGKGEEPLLRREYIF